MKFIQVYCSQSIRNLVVVTLLLVIDIHTSTAVNIKQKNVYHSMNPRGSTESEKSKLKYFVAAICISTLFACCCWICGRLCPSAPDFSALELDDIRIGRQTDIEASLSNQIDSLKKRLELQRKRRTNMETKRDIAATVEERVEKFNAKGKSIYGDAWDGQDGGQIPIKELITIPENEIREMRIEAQNIITSRKSE